MSTIYSKPSVKDTASEYIFSARNGVRISSVLSVLFLGILLCGSGNGINMSANKHQAVRSALCWKKEIAELARLHNNANVLAMPARFISYEEAQEIIEVFLETKFEGGRHERRVNKIACS